MKFDFITLAFGLTLTVFAAKAFAAAPPKPGPGAKPTVNGALLFPDKVIAKGKGFEIKQSEVDEMYISLKAYRAAIGKPLPEALRSEVEADLLNKLIGTRILLKRATDADKTKGKELSDRYIAEQMKQIASEESFNRQLVAVGLSPEQYRAQVLEGAIVNSVIDRELGGKHVIRDEDARKFYETNSTRFQQPELVRVSHVLISTRNADTGVDLKPEQKIEKRRLAQIVLDRAKAGQDFKKLIKEFSDDEPSKERDGEYTIARQKDDPSRAVAPEFEAAAFSLQTNQISALVMTRFGYHIIKALEKIPARPIEYAKVEARIKEVLLAEAVQKELPSYIDRLKQETGVEVFSSAKAE